MKPPAAQTEQATADIAHRIAEIQHAASDTATSITGVGTTIGEISAIAVSMSEVIQASARVRAAGGVAESVSERLAGDALNLAREAQSFLSSLDRD